MKIGCWNVNSIRARLHLMSDWMTQNAWDVIALQETKVSDAQFPMNFFHQQGYHVFCSGQKSYNGVALAVRLSLQCQHIQVKNFAQLDQARYIQADINGITIGCVYVPNGKEVGHSAYGEKLLFLQELRDFLKPICRQTKAFVLCGDFNVTLTDDDVGNPLLWQDKILCSKLERIHLRAFLSDGWIDSLSPSHAYGIGKKNPFTWWPYRSYGWQKNPGLRIDYALISPWAADKLMGSGVDPSWRDAQTPSDHAPIWVQIQDA